MRIYIRHGEKKYANGNSEFFKHDPGLKDEATQEVINHANFLINTYGVPIAIICSPYLRTRETARIMNSVLTNKLDIHCDPRISEYLGNHRNSKLDVHEETAEHNPPHPETIKDLDIRVKNHYEDFLELDDNNEVVWIITHGLIISNITRYLGKKYSNLPPLGTIAIKMRNSKRYYVIAGNESYKKKHVK